MGQYGTSYNKNKYSKAIVVATLSLITGLKSQIGLAKPEIIDQIVAVVNTSTILYSEVMEKVEGGQLVTVSDYPADENSSPYERAMQDSINYALIMDKIDELEMVVTDDEVEAQIEVILKNQNLNKDSLYTFLKQQNKTYDEYKDDFKKQMLLRRFQGRVIAPLIKITEKQLQTYYLKKSGASSDSLKISLRQILVKIPEGASDGVKTAKKTLADEVYQRLSGGMEFEEAVKIYSDGPNARTNGGLMQSINLKDLSEFIRVAVEPLNEAEFTAPIQSQLGYHIFYIVEKSFSGSDEFNAQKQQLEYELRTVELNNQTKRWLQENRQKAKIDILKDK